MSAEAARTTLVGPNWESAKRLDGLHPGWTCRSKTGKKIIHSMRGILSVVLWALVAASVVATEVASKPTRSLIVTDGWVQAIKEADGVVYIAGQFRRAGA